MGLALSHLTLNQINIYYSHVTYYYLSNESYSYSNSTSFSIQQIIILPPPSLLTPLTYSITLSSNHHSLTRKIPYLIMNSISYLTPHYYFIPIPSHLNLFLVFALLYLINSIHSQLLPHYSIIYHLPLFTYLITTH